MIRNFIVFFTLSILFYGCEDRSTPVVYPSEIGVAPAYAKLVRKDTPTQNINLKEIKVNKIQVKKIEKKSAKPIENIEIEEVDKIVPLSTNNTITNLVVSYGKTSAVATKIGGQTNTFIFNSDTAKKVWIKISAEDTKANIRINEIKGPIDSIKGGPLGKETIFILPIRGDYQFSVSENPTNPEPYLGKYKVDLKLLWK